MHTLFHHTPSHEETTYSISKHFSTALTTYTVTASTEYRVYRGEDADGRRAHKTLHSYDIESLSRGGDTANPPQEEVQCVSEKDDKGDLFNEAYEGSQSNEIEMIKVIMRPNQSRGFTDQTCEVPHQFAMDSSGTLRHYHIKQIIQDEADKMVSSGFTVVVYNVLRYLGQETHIILQSIAMPNKVLEVTLSPADAFLDRDIPSQVPEFIQNLFCFDNSSKTSLRSPPSYMQGRPSTREPIVPGVMTPPTSWSITRLPIY